LEIPKSTHKNTTTKKINNYQLLKKYINTEGIYMSEIEIDE